MKYKVGDKLKVRQDLVDGEHYGYLVYNYLMDKYKNVTVKSVYSDNGFYSVEENYFMYTDEMIEGLVEYAPPQARKIKKGDKVRVIDSAEEFREYIGNILTIKDICICDRDDPYKYSVEENNLYWSEDELELVEDSEICPPQHGKFKVGDKVRIAKANCLGSECIGLIGVVSEVDELLNPYMYILKGFPYGWSDDELELVEESKTKSYYNEDTGELKLVKPPLGIIPKNLWQEQRMKDLSRAINDYIQTGRYLTTIEWVEELKELIEVMEGN